MEGLKGYFKSQIQLIGSFLFLMTLMRLLFLIPARFRHVLDFITYINLFFEGFRFDLLVLGFIWIPIWIFFWILGALKKQTFFHHLLFVYLSCVWILSSFIYFNDFFYYTQRGSRFYGLQFLTRIKEEPPMNLFLSSFFQDFQKLTLQQGQFVLGLIISLFLIFLFSGWTRIFRFYIQQKQNILKFSNLKFYQGQTLNFKLVKLFFLSFILIGLAARGTLSPHHLERADSEISNIKSLNELVFNSVWTFFN